MDLLSRPVLTADHRIPYGSGPQQFGDLWRPSRASAHSPPSPLVVFFHGGWWKSEYDLGYAGYLCAALRTLGIACWSVEYRRVGETGGGFPATLHDAASAFDFTATLASRYPLDLSRVVTMGHSAGGHLAFWVAGRQHLERGSELYLPRPQVALRGAIALAGAVDLRLTLDLSGYFTFAHDRREVVTFMGGTPQQHPKRYRGANPGDLLPFNVPQFLIQGTEDDQIPPQLPQRWSEMARRLGDPVTVKILRGADHFDVVDPDSTAWPTVAGAVLSLLPNKDR